MKMLSLGIPSTLENWINLCTAVFGANSAPTLYLVEQAKISGLDEEVLADESQLLHFLGGLFVEEQEGKRN